MGICFWDLKKAFYGEILQIKASKSLKLINQRRFYRLFIVPCLSSFSRVLEMIFELFKCALAASYLRLEHILTFYIRFCRSPVFFFIFITGLRYGKYNMKSSVRLVGRAILIFECESMGARSDGRLRCILEQNIVNQCSFWVRGDVFDNLTLENYRNAHCLPN